MKSLFLQWNSNFFIQIHFDIWRELWSEQFKFDEIGVILMILHQWLQTIPLLLTLSNYKKTFKAKLIYCYYESTNRTAKVARTTEPVLTNLIKKRKL